MKGILLLVVVPIVMYLVGVFLFIYPQSKMKHGKDTLSIWKDMGLAFIPVPIFLIFAKLFLNKKEVSPEFDKKILPPAPVTPEQIELLEIETETTHENIQNLIKDIEDTVRTTDPATSNPDFEERLRRKS